ncbi:MAG: hypothetical protein QXZ24_05250 [Candidatus Jordarchaeales archaeon]
MEVRVGGGFARLVDCGEFSVLYVSGLGVEVAARAFPGLRVLRVGGGVVVTCGGRPVVPVVGGGFERCVERASRVFDGGSWRRVRFSVACGRAVALGSLVAGVASLFFPLSAFFALLFAVCSLVFLALSLVFLRGLARQVVYCSGEGEVAGDLGYFAEAALLCCEKARRLVSEGRSEEAAEYALKALKYASEVVEVEVGGGVSPLEVVEAVERAVRSGRRKQPSEASRPAVEASRPAVGASRSAAGEGVDVDELVGVVEAYAGGEKGVKGGRLEDYF